MSILFVYLNIFLYYSYFYLYFWDVGVLPIKPLYWFLSTIVVGLTLVVFKHGFRMPPLKFQRLLVWSIVFLSLSTFSAVFVSGGDPDSIQQLILYVEGVSILVVFALLLQDERIAKHAIYAIFIVVVATVVINFIDFFRLTDIKLSTVAGRAAGMYANPNISGKFLVLGMAITVFALPRKLRFFYCIFVLAGVVLTFSRASIMLWAVTVVALTWYRTFVLPRSLSFTVMGSTVALLGVLLVAGAWMNIFESIGMSQYLDENTQARISGSFIGQDDYSSHGRMAVAKKGISTFLNSPLFGKGIGSGNDFTDGLRAHNSYIQLAAEQGIFGLGFFLGLMWIIWIVKSDISRVFIMAFAGFSLFTHNMLDQPAMYLALALAVAGLSRTSTEKAEVRVDKPVDIGMTVNSSPVLKGGSEKSVKSFAQPKLRR